MRKGNLLVSLCGLLLVCWMNIAIATADGLILGFKSGNEVQLVSVVTTQLPVRGQPTFGLLWRMRATDSSGSELWRRSFVAPRQFDGLGSADLSFVVVVPRADSGTRLSMQDENSIEIWRGSIDEAMLRVAEETGASIRQELAQTSKKSALAGETSDAVLALRTRQADVDVGPEMTGKDSKAGAATKDLPTPSARDRLSESIRGEQPVFAASDSQKPIQISSSAQENPTLMSGNNLNPSIPVKSITEDTWELDVHLLDPSGHPLSIVPTGQVFSWDDSGTGHYPFDASPGRIRARVPQRTDLIYRLSLIEMPGYTREIAIRAGTIAGNTRIDVTLVPASQVRIRLMVEGGSPIPNGPRGMGCSSAAQDPQVNYYQHADFGSASEATLRLPYNTTLDCTASIANGTLQVSFNDIEFSSSSVKTLTLPQTGDVTIRLLEENGTVFSGPISAVWYGSNAISSCGMNPCHLLLPSQIPTEIHVYFHGGIYRDFSIGPEIFPSGTLRTISLKQEHSVKGSVVFTGLEYRVSQVRALDSATGKLMLSTTTEWPSDRFELPLVEGTYVFEAERNLDTLPPGEAFYRAPWRSNPIHISQDTELPAFIAEDDVGQLALTAEVPCHGTGSYHSDFAAQVAITSANGTRIERVIGVDRAGTTTTAPCVSRYLAGLSAGAYEVEFSPVGWPAQSLGSVLVTAGQTTTRNAAFSSSSRTLVWSGTLRTASSEAVAGAWIDLFDGASDNRISTWTDSQGRFELPFEPGWIARIKTGTFQAGTAAVPKIVHLGSAPPPSSIRLDDLPMTSELDSGLYRLFGDGQRENRFNLVFVAEGYTEIRESFTDSNGNGMWDGVVWYDLDGDGVYSQGDLTQTYGTASYPREGAIPTAGNEPFTDNNADGFPNLDDRGLFIENVRAFLKSLFGSDFWDRHRNAFNAYVLFEPSEQAGYNVVSSSGEILLTRNTRYSATLDQSRGILSIDRQAMLNRVLVAMPDADLAVAMLNQPVASGRANASSNLLLYNGGAANVSTGSATPAHEMGHAIGGLCDEYIEFEGVSPTRGQPTSHCANASFSPNPAHIPWASSLAPGSNIPSSNIDGSVGVYEGAAYFPGGAYRPTYRSIMRDLTPLFNAPSRAALEMAVHTRTGEWHDEADASGRCARLPPNAIQRRGVACQ